jgi:magnesium and cobalt transporter
MSSNPDPSSPAARGAQNDEEEIPGQRPGFLARLFGATPIAERMTSTVRRTRKSVSRTATVRVPWACRTCAVYGWRMLPFQEPRSSRSPATSLCRSFWRHFRSSGLTRLPVYDGTLDVPVGLVHLKDIALKYGFQQEAGGFTLRTTLRPLLYAPPSMPIGVLLTKMQTDRTHMALVIDEYGGVDGW